MSSRTLVQLTADSPTDDDILYFVKNPGGTPLDRKVTLANLGSALDITSLAGFPGGTTDFLRADGTWAAAGGSSPTGDANAVAFFDAMGNLDSTVDFKFDPTTDSGKLRYTTALANEGATVFYVDNGVQGTFDTAIAARVSISDNDTITANKMVGLYVTAGVTGTLADRLVAIRALASPNGAGTANAIGLEVLDVSGATNNYAIKTGTGDIVLGTLAGVGTRAVVVDANGKLSAP